MTEQNIRLMQNEDKFNTEKFKDFKFKKISIYIRKSIYKLKS